MTTLPRSDGLAYRGEGRFLPGIPAIDLTVAQLAAIARDRGQSIATLRARLVASGLYAPARSKKP